jgi:hypothetical protein
MKTPVDSPEDGSLRVRLSFLAPALIPRFDAHGRLKTGFVIGLTRLSLPIVLWDDDPLAVECPATWLELRAEDPLEIDET